jgi:hypothetical protein
MPLARSMPPWADAAVREASVAAGSLNAVMAVAPSPGKVTPSSPCNVSPSSPGNITRDPLQRHADLIWGR